MVKNTENHTMGANPILALVVIMAVAHGVKEIDCITPKEN